MRKALFGPVLLALAVAGCDLSLDPYDPDRDIDGYYSYSGRVDGTSRYNVVGAIRITDSYWDEAYVTIDWLYRDGNRTLLDVTSRDAARARIDSRGNIRFVFEGEFRDGGRWVWFELVHDGRIQGRTISGDWRLRTGLQTDERGSFTARR